MILHFLTAESLAGDLSGEGGFFSSGRWNLKGYYCIYACPCHWQCMVEYLANVPMLKRPTKLALAKIEVPEGSVTIVDMSLLNPGWDGYPMPAAGRRLGTEILKKCETLLIQYPSSVRKDQKIYVLNTMHPKMEEVKLLGTELVTLPLRLR